MKKGVICMLLVFILIIISINFIFSAIPTPKLIPLATPTSSPTPSPTVGPTPGPSPSPTPSPTASPTPTPSPTPSPDLCIDSDNGMNLEVRGYTSNLNRGDSYHDSCVSQNEVNKGSCEDNTIKIITLSCPNMDCVNGACSIGDLPTQKSGFFSSILNYFKNIFK